mgnify:CR=1 FL=1
MSMSTYALFLCFAVSGDKVDYNQVKNACKYMPIVLEESHNSNVDPLLVAAIIEVESDWRTGAESSAGACGLMQVIPRWNPRQDGNLHTCKNLKNPKIGIRAGVRAIRRWLNKADGDIVTALCAYNAGNSCFFKVRGEYVKKVLDSYAEFLDNAKELS